MVLAAMLPVPIVIGFVVLLLSSAQRIARTSKELERDRAIEADLEHVIVTIANAPFANSLDSITNAVASEFSSLHTKLTDPDAIADLSVLETDVMSRLSHGSDDTWGPSLASSLALRAHDIAHAERKAINARRRHDRRTDGMVVTLMIAAAIVSASASILTMLWLSGQAMWLAKATERLRRQKLATETARRHAREMLQSMSDIVIVIDESWKVRSVVPADTAFANFDPSSRKGMSFDQAWPDIGERVREELGKSMRAQLPMSFEEFVPAWDAWVEFWTLPSDSGLLVYLKDTSEVHRQRAMRERLASKIERAATEWQQLFDAMDTPILVLDAHGRILRLNEQARRVAGKDYRSLIGGNVHFAGDAEFWQSVGRLTADVQLGRSTRELKSEDKKTGRTWDIRATHFTLPEDSPARVIVQAHDVTDVVALENRVRIMDKLSTIGTVTAGVAHEVRNPLFSISSLVDALESSLPDSSELSPFLDRLRRQVERLRNLMADLLEFGKASVPDTMVASIVPVIESAMANATPVESSVSVRLEVEPGLPTLMMDAGRLELVFRNLIENALQHSPADGEVVIQAKAEGAWLQLSVADRGAGFEQGDVAHVFEPFFTRRRGGTGLGLSIVQRIVMEHHGSVLVHNRDGGGAEVVVRLPLASATHRLFEHSYASA